MLGTVFPLSIYTTKKLQSICGILTFLNLKNSQHFLSNIESIKLFYLYPRLQCTDNYFLEIKFVFFLYLLLWLYIHESWNKNDVLIYFCYQTDSGVPNTSIYPAIFLASPYYNDLLSTASMTNWYVNVVTGIA